MSPAAIAALELLRADPRRGVYEAADVGGRHGSGEFYVDYSNGRSPRLTRTDVDELVDRGYLVPAYPDLDGVWKRGPAVSLFPCA